MEVVYPKVLLAKLSCYVWRYVVQIGLSHWFDCGRSDLCELPERQQDLRRAGALSAARDTGPDIYIDGYANVNCLGDTFAYIDANCHVFVNADEYAYGDINLYVDSDRYLYTNRNANCYADIHLYRYSDTYVYPNGYSQRFAVCL
jgi:hypothetical protein